MKLKNNLSAKSRVQEYTSKGFDASQLIEIRKGLDANIDVAKYANIKYIDSVMRLLRELMTFDSEFELGNYVTNGTLEIYELLRRHMSLVHPHGEITPLSPSSRKHIISRGPYYVIDKGESSNEIIK